MSNTSKDENLMLEQAYMRVYEARMSQIESGESVEESTDDEPENDKMAAAVAVQQTADQVEDEGGEVTQQLQKAKQESEKYVSKKISQFKKD